MIDEKKTFERFGYYSTDWAPKSNKKIIAICDKCGKERVLKKDSYRDLCNSCSHKKLRIGKFCFNCGKVYFVLPYKVERYKFCSYECYYKYNLNYGNPNCGKTHSEETRKKISEARKGENHPNWRGGISFEPYCPSFNETFKEQVREYFGRKCLLCKKTKEENGNRRLSIHHIDYNKNQGCDGSHWLVCPLCTRCHIKTNKDRDKWQRILTEKVQNYRLQQEKYI